jgi:alpha-amylase/alpha-mannosidase (GH57 family)
MPHIYLCFVWHMHQPFYKDLLTGEYRLPWTRLHALKDYYGMVKILGEFPQIRQTFNLVPSMMVQIEEYASGQAADPFLRAALKPAEDLSEDEQDFILHYFFHANPARMIHRYPRYGELYAAWQNSERNPKRARRFFGAAEMRDLQVLSQLAWFDEEDLESHPEVRGLVDKAQGYNVQDQTIIGRTQMEALRRVAPTYRKFANSGQIEISTTPFYHPILPLICDSDIAESSHPYIHLPSRFRYPEDAREQLTRAREYMTAEFGHAPRGLWPSEGSVSDEALSLAAGTGFSWAASDNGVLARTLQRDCSPALTYRPYLWQQDGRELRMIFRDHHLSDLIGFVYARMDATEAAAHFLAQIRDKCRDVLAEGRDALVPIILDGENAWEYYDRNGRPFLRELYQRIQDDTAMSAITVSEALDRVPPERIGHIFPGSWIDANFDIWIGAEEDNRAWEYLLRARRAYDCAIAANSINAEKQQLAFEELLIAEGSDWCWWYGPEHQSANRPEFDRLFRDHVANVYRVLGLQPPEELSQPILQIALEASHEAPTGLIRPKIDGEISSYFEWLGAGVYKVDSRSGAMHGQRFMIRELHYGTDGSSLFLRLDFEDRPAHNLQSTTLNLQIAPLADPARVTSTSMPVTDAPGNAGGIEYAYRKIYEIRVPLSSIGAALRQPVRFQLSLWQNGLPLDALPKHGWLEVSTSEPNVWGF